MNEQKYKSNYDELERNYTKRKLFINPPFSKMDKVIKWVIKQYYNDNKIALLISGRSEHMQAYCKYQEEIEHYI